MKEVPCQWVTLMSMSGILCPVKTTNNRSI